MVVDTYYVVHNNLSLMTHSHRVPLGNVEGKVGQVSRPALGAQWKKRRKRRGV